MAQPPTWSTTFANDGGPLIVLPRDLLGYWKGSEGVSSRDDFPFGPDYARACEASTLLTISNDPFSFSCLDAPILKLNRFY